MACLHHAGALGHRTRHHDPGSVTVARTRARRSLPERGRLAATWDLGSLPSPGRRAWLRVPVVPDLHRACNDLDGALVVGVGALVLRAYLEVAPVLEVGAGQVHLAGAAEDLIAVQVDDRDVVFDPDLHVEEVPDVVRAVADDLGLLAGAVVPTDHHVEPGGAVALGLDAEVVAVGLVDLPVARPRPRVGDLGHRGAVPHVVGALAVPPEIVVAVLSDLAVLAAGVAGALAGAAGASVDPVLDNRPFDRVVSQEELARNLRAFLDVLLLKSQVVGTARIPKADVNLEVVFPGVIPDPHCFTSVGRISGSGAFCVQLEDVRGLTELG